MTLEKRIQAFSKLGKQILQNKNLFETTGKNTWFVKEFVEFAIEQTAEILEEPNLRKWLSNYKISEVNEKPKQIAVILAGNIPLVGFHDFLCVLISGNIFIGKLSSKDDKFPEIIAKLLMELEPEFKNSIQFVQTQLKDFDAVIATGSNNSSRYFEYYFSKYPHIFRKNRNSVAVLSGNETKEELELLADDLFIYFGLGCRNVSKIFVPQNYKLDSLFEACSKYKHLINHNKYSNNYGYNRAIFLMNNITFWDNGFLLLTENTSFSSAVSVVHFEYYPNLEYVRNEIEINSQKIQCLVSANNLIPNSLPLGTSQKPGLSDFADNIDTLQWLCEMSFAG